MDWELFFGSVQTQNKSSQAFLTKYNSRTLPVGTNLKRRKHALSDICPCCGEIETHDHLIKCGHSDMEQTYNKAYQDICAYMHSGTNGALCDGVLQLLDFFRTDTEDHLHDNGMQIALDQQRHGARAFFAGLWINQWRSRQERYYESVKSTRSPKIWMTRLVHKVHNIPFSMWKMRNTILHQSNENYIHQEQNNDLDHMIDIIFARKPHARSMTHCDNKYFTRYGIEKVKKMKIRRKINWVTGANLILDKYTRVSMTQTERFMSYFQWDRG